MDDRVLSVVGPGKTHSRKRPGLTRGAKIAARPKMTDTLVERIVAHIQLRSLERPESPYSYAELAEEFGYSAVALRNRPKIAAAVEVARQTAEHHRAARSAADPDQEKDRSEQQRLEKESIRRELDELRAFKQRALQYFYANNIDPESVLNSDRPATSKKATEASHPVLPPPKR